MTWYAIRTAPGAQMPKREYATETTNSRRGKGYRIVPSLNPNESAIERELKQEGFTCYIPVIKRLMRDKRKFGVWKSRRFPMLQGYVFVQDVKDWPRLEATAGVAGIVGTNGRPLAILEADIEKLAAEEARAEEAFQKEQKRREEADAIRGRKLTRRKLGQAFKPGSVVDITKGHAAGRAATITGLDRGGRLKAMLDGLGTISLSPEDVALVAAE